MEDIEKLIDNLITTDKFDERVALYIKEFFLYNARYFSWDEKIITRKAKILEERVKKFEFVNLIHDSAIIDHESNNALLNSLIKNIEYDKNSAVALISTVFEKLEILSAINTDVFNQDNYGKTYSGIKIKLKYSVNQKEKERLTNITNIFDNLNYYDQFQIEKLLINSSDYILNSDNAEENFYTYTRIFVDLIHILNENKDGDTTDLAQLKEDMILLKEMMIEIRKENMDIAITEEKLKKYGINLEKSNNEFKELQQFFYKKDVGQTEKIRKNINNFKEDISEEFIENVRPEFEYTQLSDEYLNEKIKMLEEKYEPQFVPIIKEYFIRSATVYHWSKEEFDKKFNNFLKNLDKIKIVKKIDKSLTVCGKYLINKKEVIVCADTPACMLDTFFHEFTHVTDLTQRDSRKLENALEYNSITETATETGTVQIKGENPYEDELCFTRKMDGYDVSNRAISMISASLGINEFEFAKLRDNTQLDIEWIEKFEVMGIELEEVLNKFDNILSEAFSSYSTYNPRKQKNILALVYPKIFKLSLDIIGKRIAYEKQNLDNYNDERFNTKCRYENTKIAVNMQKAIKEYKIKPRKYIDEGGNNFLNIYGHISNNDRENFLEFIESENYNDYKHFNNSQLYKHITGFSSRSIIRSIILKVMQVREKKIEQNFLPPNTAYVIPLNNRCRTYRKDMHEEDNMQEEIIFENNNPKVEDKEEIR